MTDPLSEKDKLFLLTLARNTIEQAVNQKSLPTWDENQCSEILKRKGASFVTLTIDGQLRGCIGTLEAYQSLVEDVRDHARQAALEDYRFPPVTVAEVPLLRIEISRLTVPEVLKYDHPESLPQVLKPGIDGVILKDGIRRATFLPQVWQQIPDPDEFLSHLCQKMGSPANLWKQKMLGVCIYRVEEFQEPDRR